MRRSSPKVASDVARGSLVRNQSLPEPAILPASRLLARLLHFSFNRNRPRVLLTPGHRRRRTRSNKQALPHPAQTLWSVSVDQWLAVLLGKTSASFHSTSPFRSARRDNTPEPDAPLPPLALLSVEHFPTPSLVPPIITCCHTGWSQQCTARTVDCGRCGPSCRPPVEARRSTEISHCFCPSRHSLQTTAPVALFTTHPRARRWLAHTHTHPRTAPPLSTRPLTTSGHHQPHRR
jgi:hypothetical protein